MISLRALAAVELADKGAFVHEAERGVTRSEQSS